MRIEVLGKALETVVRCKAERFLQNKDYLEHVRRCIKTLKPKSYEEAFVLGGLDAMLQDFGSAAQMTRPPKSAIDISWKENRIDRMSRWQADWLKEELLKLRR